MTTSHTYAVLLEPEPDGGFTVRVPALPEIVSYGEDEAEALAMAEDAIRLVVEDRLARGEPVPDDAKPRIHEVTVTLAA
ncbi:MAG: type II toxin-antitoxin system HicB family antitoxin [Rhodoplanes sp.]|uniref:type II toxin-antitoxin system HicB family antitoxin n=1 Tax=Rhodoplanes sp. TaxID=1968906 RepID=UPI001824935E|nr:type II toxin-antitoxin system HicB family antitoxin [Rhodoplanes sp.]NVO13387.1 type II toxin-antitoxin system HicB family antitoxin [Rhodoplanes sp.]